MWEKRLEPGGRASGLPLLLPRKPAPPLDGATGWLNVDAPPSWVGRVVAVEFWTYGCINCVRTLPHVVRMHERLAPRGLVTVGVHSPEFPSERERRNVIDACVRHRIEHPVALDNDHAIWRAWRTQFWPTLHLVDKQGRVAY